MRRFCIALGLAMMVLVPGVSSAQSEQLKRTYSVPFEMSLNPDDYPCLTETIYATGTYQVNLHVVITPAGTFSYQLQQTSKDITAVGQSTGETYKFRGSYATTQTGTTDEPWVTYYLLEYTLHIMQHFIGPGDLPDIALRLVFHITLDRVTGEVKAIVYRNDVLCH